MNRVLTPQSRCLAGVARCDITPPVGIYHRMWGAALHDRSTGVHRPLEATLLWLEPREPAVGSPQIIIALDHCILDGVELHHIRAAAKCRLYNPLPRKSTQGFGDQDIQHGVLQFPDARFMLVW